MALAKPVDARTDIYALGCVGFWLLTGQLVFPGDTPLSIVTQHVSQPPPRVSSCTELPVPRELEDLLDACLAKDPQRRPQSAGELAQRLNQVPVTQPWTQQHAADWWDSLRPTG
jgi:serine/threonine-protein kinase